MSAYISRVPDAQVERSLATFGAVIIEGPRAVGKTSTGLHHAASSVRLDANPALADLADAAPASVLSGETPRLIDEWQLAPRLWNVVRHEVDNRRKPGQFILTGSATPADDITRHTGAGRFRRVRLRPMSLAESGDSTSAVSFAGLMAGSQPAAIGGPELEQHVAALVRGGWPTLVTNPSLIPAEYLGAYLDDVARVDLPSTEQRVDPVRMEALIRAVARNTATEAQVTKLAAEAAISEDDDGISSKTARRYLDALTRVFVLEELPAWAVHLRSKVRLRRQPKWHFVDPSLGAVALGASTTRLLDDAETLGFFFESLCIRDLRIYAGALDGRVYHYRDETNLEVDAIAEFRDGRWAAFEVKLGSESGIDDGAKALRSLASKVSSERASALVGLYVLTAGTISYRRPDGVNVVALGHLGP